MARPICVGILAIGHSFFVPHRRRKYAINVAIGGKADMTFCNCICRLMTQSGHQWRVYGTMVQLDFDAHS
jgi:hypothetical protein